MDELYTYGRWVVKAGQEDAFRAAWKEFADWTAANIGGPGRGRLLRDPEDPTLFLSFGPWESQDAIVAWRSNPGFQERVGRIRQMLESFEAHTLRVVAEA